jgi:V8-like Glu-specific endopeptidase
MIAPAAALLLILTATFADAADRHMLPAHEQRGWNGVGRLNFGDGFCTAALIAPSKIVTAAHCLFSPRAGRPRPLSSMRFIAGCRLRKHQGNAGVRGVRFHPRYAYNTRPDARGVAADIAVLTLDRRMRFVGYALNPTIERRDPVTVLSYGRDRPEIASIQSGCPVRRRVGGAVELGCAVPRGASGAPVFTAGGLVAVISARGADPAQNRSWAAALEPELIKILSTP